MILREEQLKTFLSIVPNEEEAIDDEVLDKRVCSADGRFKIYQRIFHEMFQVDELWKNQEDWILKSWNLYENCRVHILMLEDGTEFHMLDDKKVSLSKKSYEKMLV
ncbi:hypothetical protein Tco_1176258 [Tanacetum coccineum]